MTNKIFLSICGIGAIITIGVATPLIIFGHQQTKLMEQQTKMFKLIALGTLTENNYKDNIRLGDDFYEKLRDSIIKKDQC